MNTICVHFFGPFEVRDQAAQIQVNTTCVPGGLPGAFPTCDIDPSQRFDWAIGALDTLTAQLQAALDQGGPYPVQAAANLRTHLGWNQGFQALERTVNTGSVQLQFQFNYHTCRFIPELLPLQGNNRWLDMAGPIHRTLDVLLPPVVPRCRDRSLAIVSATPDPDQPQLRFDLAAESLQEQLQRHGITVNTFRGEEFRTTDSIPLALLQRIFLRHRAVLFLGHLTPADGEAAGGWRLSEQCDLSMRTLRSFFRAEARGHRDPVGRQPRWGIPEVIFANCCFSAGRDTDSKNDRGLSYPALFLEAGVRFFIGTSMDVVFNQNDIKGDFDKVTALALGFFRRWASSPDDVVSHLYEAKRELGFPLLSSLYQLYTGVGLRPGAEESPVGAIISGLRAGDQLGDFHLGQQCWADLLSRTFIAVQPTTRTAHLVQVLADQRAENRRLIDDYTVALVRLRAAGLGERHLIPEQLVDLRLSRTAAATNMPDSPACPVTVLVYDRPEGETASDWSALVAHGEAASAHERFAALVGEHRTAEFFRRVVALGADLAEALAEMHGKRLLHGNLAPSSVVFLRQGHDWVMRLKDGWGTLAHSGRSAPARFTPPELLAEGAVAADQASDVWALGATLFEILTGRSAFDDAHPPEQGLRLTLAEALGDAAGLVPPGLGLILRECLIPTGRLRPDVQSLARRLRRIEQAPDLVGSFEAELNARLQSGQRLFVLMCDTLDDAERTLRAMATHPHANLRPDRPGYPKPVQYRLYIAAEERGLIDVQSNRILERWLDRNGVANALRIRSVDLGPRDVSHFNASLVFEHVRANLVPAKLGGSVPLLLVCGNSWWDSGPTIWRILRSFQTGGLDAPAVVVADDLRVNLEWELSRHFATLRLPPPPPPDLFETILSFPQTQGFPDVPVSEQTAMQLADALFPCGRPETQRLLRIGAIRYGAVDERVLAQREEKQVAAFRGAAVASYTPTALLPDPAFLGLPPALEESVRQWSEGSSQTNRRPVALRILITGPGGCGKTELARSLGARTGRSLVRIDVAACLRGRLGETEAVFRQVLATVGAVPRCLVLFDDLDRVFGFHQTALGTTAPDKRNIWAGFTRLMSDLLRWLDHLPADLAVVATATNRQVLPPEWQRRWEMELPLVEPTETEDRMRILAALFRRHQLPNLAEDQELLQILAEETNPQTRTRPLLGPMQRLHPEVTVPGLVLSTGAELAAWMNETICLLDSAQTPAHERAFWLEAVR